MSNDGEEEHRPVGWNCADSNHDQSWDLSLVGEWDSFTENATTQQRTHSDAHEILIAASQSVTHDAKGNQTGLVSNLATSTSGLTLEWDFENKLHAADVDGTSGADILQKFDALGRRISRDDGTTTTVFVPSGQQTIADYTAGTAASSPTYRYVYASYIDEPVMRAGSTSTAKLCYHRNQQYSVTALTDTTGTISERYAYDAYGKLSVFDGGGSVLSGSAYGNRYTYTGREWDGELGLYHYRARMYSPESGRFISRDPIGHEDNATNLYAGYFAFKAAMDPGGNRWVAPWHPSAEWWWPFDEIPAGTIPNAVGTVMNAVCPWIQSDGATCTCCAIEAVDVSAGIIGAVLPREIPGFDEAMNIADFACDGLDMLNSLCTVWNGTATLPVAQAINASAIVSCVINAIDNADITGLFADRILAGVELLQAHLGQRLLIGAGCNPCKKACGF